MNAIAMIKKDHREIESMLNKLEKGGGNVRERQKLVQSLVRALSIHSAAEETVIYPIVRKRVPKLTHEVLKSLEEHHLMKVTLAELLRMKMTDERLLPKIEVLADDVRAHVEDEEERKLPALTKALSVAELNNLGLMFDRAKKAAPTRPHPVGPDTPPANLVAGVGEALFDRARDVGREALNRVRRVGGVNGRAHRTPAPRARNGRGAGTRGAAHAR